MPGALVFTRLDQGHTGRNNKGILIDTQRDSGLEYNDEKNHMAQSVLCAQ